MCKVALRITSASATVCITCCGGLQVSGAKFYYLRNEAALLELALVNWTMQRVVAAGFTPIITPDLVRESVFEKCGFQPRADKHAGGPG